MRNVRARNIIYIGIAFLLLTACQKQEGIHEFRPTPVEGWSRSDTLSFDVPVAPQGHDYDLSVEARITPRYEYSDLWLVTELQTTLPHHHGQLLRDTIRLNLTDSLGRFNGQGNDLLQYSSPTLRRLRLRQGETGTLHIRHIMDEHSLLGVHDIGVRLLPSHKTPTQK